LSRAAPGKADGMTDEKRKPDDEDVEETADPELLPDREVMSLIAPGGGGFAGIIPAIGPEPGITPAPLPPGVADGAAAGDESGSS
jgi:hypothetical protein